MRMLKSTGRVAILTLALLAVGAVQARSQNAVLYELAENMKLRAGDTRRDATAALGGTAQVGSSICPASFAASLGLTSCTLNATATDNVDLSTGKGPATGHFMVVIQGDNPVDAAELVVLEGTLTGTVDLSPALDSIPLGSIVGRWNAVGTPGGPLAGVKAGGPFHGTFRLPFVSPDAPNTPLYLLDPATGQVRPVAENELALGVPTVRLELEFN